MRYKPGSHVGSGSLREPRPGVVTWFPDWLAASLGEQPPWTQAEMLQAALGGRGRGRMREDRGWARRRRPRRAAHAHLGLPHLRRPVPGDRAPAGELSDLPG